MGLNNKLFLLCLLVLFSTLIAYSYSIQIESLDNNNKINVIQYLKKNLVADVKPSKIHGVGLFAIIDIPAGTHLFTDVEVKDENTIDIKEDNLEVLNESQIHYINKITDTGDSEDTINIANPRISSINLVPITTYINHSTTPNIKWSAQHHSWITILPILKNDEILSDYSYTNVGKYYI